MHEVGYLGILMPVILLVLCCISLFETTPQPSISDFYFTNLRELFTGTMCSVGLFMICYRGNNNPNPFKNDHLLTNIAGVMAVGVAFFPTFPMHHVKMYSIIPSSEDYLGWVHYGFAGTLF